MHNRNMTRRNTGRKNYAQIDAEKTGGEMIALAKGLRSRSYSLRQISDELRKEGFLTRMGKPYGPAAVARMLGELRQITGKYPLKRDAQASAVSVT